MQFEEYVKGYVAKSLQVEYLLDEIGYGLLRNIVEHCMNLPQYHLERTKQVQVILSVLFSQLVRGYSFDDFLKRVPKNEQVPFLTALLYHIYYINLKLEHLVSCDKLTFYLFRILASFASEKTILELFDKFSPTQKRQCLSFCILHFDEGAYRLFQILSKRAEEKVVRLLAILDRKLVDKKEVADWIAKHDEIDNLIVACNKDLNDRIKRVHALLTKHKYKVAHVDLKRCLLLFGLYDAQVPKEAKYLHEYPALDDKLKAMKKLGRSEREFIDAFLAHVKALATHPQHYLKGIELITFALPTAGKELSQFAWLGSMVDGLNSFADYFKVKLDIPFYVFDQSEKALFQKNRKYIKSLKSHIVHLDTDAILALAQRLGVEGLIVTTKEGAMGYGGARNAIFFLAPLLRYYHKQGIRPETLTDAKLRRDWQEVVLQEKRGPCLIHMGDDDVHIPKSTLFSDALFAYHHQKEYFCRYGWVIGRQTTWTVTTFNLKYVLERSSDILLQHEWKESPFLHGMAGLLTKPKLSLNLPFGQEEAYLQATKRYAFDFRLPSLHLSGYRFPKCQLPANRFSGLAELLCAHYLYSIGMMIVADIVDPTNTQKHCALPWNDRKKPFKNLYQAMQSMLEPKTIKEMQRRFESNMRLLHKAFKKYRPEMQTEQSTLHLALLNSQDVQSTLAEYKQKFPEEAKELETLFMALAKDGASFQKALAMGLECKSKPGYPFTNALVLLCDVVGRAGFQQTLKLALRSQR